MINLKNLAIDEFKTTSTDSNVGHFVVDSFVGTSFLTLNLYQKTKDNILIYCANNFEVNEMYNSLSTFVKSDDIITIPSDELLRVEYLSESKEMLAQQIYGLYSLLGASHKIIILAPSSLYKFYPSKELFMESCLKLKVGETYDFNKLKEQLQNICYSRVQKIDQSLQYAIRGDIVDIYSLNYENPIRIEFFGDEIESIRFFSIANQISYEQVNEVTILPASLILFTPEEKSKIESKIKNVLLRNKDVLPPQIYQELVSQTEEDIEDLKTSNLNSKFYKYYGFLKEDKCNLLDYISGSFKVIVNNEDDFFNSKNNIFSESEAFLNELFKEGRSISNLKYFNNEINIFNKSKYIYYLNNFYIHSDSIQLDLVSNFLYSSRDIDITRLLEMYSKNDYKILCLLENKEQINKIISCIDELKFTYALTKDFDLDDTKNISLTINSFPKGFEFKEKKIVVLTSKELFGFRRHVSTYSSKFKEGVVIESYQDLQPGDYVVHEKNGIGRFTEVSTLEINGKHEDFIKIQYDGTDVLYVPLYRVCSVIRKYVGKDGYVPKLNKLSGNKWETTKKKIKERINVLAERLMDLYSARAKVKGVSFKGDDEIEAAFAADFEYELTKDQQKSLEEIYKDMESETPMDRLLCGDVGFGKTEIAFRAAFRAIMNGKMAIILCPTTLLARQHYEVALKRFSKFKVKIALYSRMTTPQESKNIESLIKDKKIDLLIGTHKVLSDKIDISNLGLLVIDEEQRFGVEQKEKIKEKSKSIDVLTLSATPIPRTLQSSLVGLKQVSTITTPPKERVAIQTYVIPYDKNVVRELIKRELSRHGQIFYIHNDIATIYETCDKLQKLVPECKIGIVHGRMDKEDVNNTMQDFYDNKINLLLATSIIENGIDVENANLMLIENANAFGLAQLYQIKGRVGRGDRLAFAYLMINKNKEINEDAKKRLEAIQDFTALGSGYKIAQRDLLIRGAGDILGPEQAGFIDAVGIDMYIKLLNETIEEKKTGIKKAEAIKIHKNLGIDAYIPSTYVLENEKIEVYQKILNCNSFDELKTTENNLRDIYGPMPDGTKLLFLKRELDIYLEKEEFKDLNEYQDHVDLVLSTKFSDLEGIGTALFTALISYLKEIKISFVNKEVNIIIKKRGDWVDLLLKICNIVDNLYESTRKAKTVYEA